MGVLSSVVLAYVPDLQCYDTYVRVDCVLLSLLLRLLLVLCCRKSALTYTYVNTTAYVLGRGCPIRRHV